MSEIYAQRMLRVCVFIQEHLDEELSLEKLAKLAHFSPYHFHRIFTAYVGESVHAYVRRLRIARAAMQLSFGEKSVTEIAFDAGYESSAAFSKAFRQVIGTSPSRFRGRVYKYLTIQGKNIMRPEIVTLEDSPVMFMRHRGPYDGVSALWKQMWDFVEEHKLDANDVDCFGLSHDDPAVTDPSQLRYDACIQVPKKPSANKMEEAQVGEQVIRGGQFAVFTHIGPYHTIPETFKRIYTEWLPTSGAKLAERPTPLRYLNPQIRDTAPEGLVTRIYIPLAA